MSAWKHWYTKSKILLVAQFFISGMEYSVILPTLEPYLEEFKDINKELFFGLIYASFYFSGCIFATVLGRISDKTLKFRLVILTINAIAAIGNAFYSIGGSVYLILFGRFLAGAAEALYPVVYGEVGRCFRGKKFDREAEHLMIGYCVGLSIGPGINMIPTNQEWNIGVITIRYTNAPGLLLFVSNTILLILVYFFLDNLSLKNQEFPLIDDKLLIGNVEITHCETLCLTDCKPIKHNKEKSCQNDEVIIGRLTVSTKPWFTVLKEFLKRKDICILIYGNIVWSYTTVTANAVLPLTASNILHFSTRTIALYYLSTGLLFGAVLAFSPYLTTRFDRITISIGAFISNVISNIFLSLCYLGRDFNYLISRSLLFLFTAASLVGWCFNSIHLKILLSQCVPKEDQSFCQAIFSLSEYVTSIISGLTSGYLYNVLLEFSGWSMVINLIVIFLMTYYNNLFVITDVFRGIEHRVHE